MNDAQLEKALGLLRRVAEAIAKLPSQLQMHVEVGEGTVEVTFESNPADTRRLVGRDADNLKQLAALFRLLARNTGKIVRLCDLIPNNEPEPPFKPYTPDLNWPRAEIEGLLRDLAEAVFELPAEVTTEPHNAFSVKMRVTILGDLTGNRVLSIFDKACNVLFVPIGTNNGMKIYAHAQDYCKAITATRTPANGRASSR